METFINQYPGYTMMIILIFCVAIVNIFSTLCDTIVGLVKGREKNFYDYLSEKNKDNYIDCEFGEDEK